ncbi:MULTISPECIES: glycerophosphodiester phosphodiesterase family protein [Methylobacterium]|uniref:GP-PDE domain-containing protein n=1 Tax=Methylobacterium jeotgali TaxID=381630 RepID=A0ABQ4SRB7_9HYPH|nr:MULTISPECIES: glycerophosphodiester phosphodiesterase family protein [Methylobacterium]PIU07845.1 MAG: glycerophosphodiester phosphodiesterase [Methylobacterium sp. CG09_land_8_20_14_0_10_71_15]PIU11044.1 MAG: glycerophosphodiester phosphodiesterase [Methylobacterium sp. CG08_land_8_20_14_0_20_71_15]GBU16005.1 glycerophosphoryl diester phosphodiesterase [Methylobacterium sp.]GJE05637.1 hypothetical protein AOPFMNJM_0940 [Methylobacterium jeotgali]
MPAPGWLVARPIAHRGLHARDGRPENTLAAARAAVAAGYAIECDVRLSGDGQVMVFHDETLGRLTGAAGRVDATPASVLAGLKVLGTAETIPTLGDLLATVGGRVPLVVELKSDYSGDPGLARRVAEMVAGYDGPLALKSFDPAIVGQLRPLAPERPRGIVAEATQDDPAYALLPEGLRRALANLLHLGESRPDFLSWRVGDLPHAAPYLCRHLGRMPVMTWTVRSPEQAEHARRHADQIVFEGFLV